MGNRERRPIPCSTGAYQVIRPHLQFYHSWTKFLVILRQWISGEHQRNLVISAVPNMPLAGAAKLCLACFAVEHYCPSHHEMLPHGCCHLQRDPERIK